jgi:predicted RNase H-like HicB family nuclease
MKLKAIVHEAEEGGYWAEVPALPGCVTQGETLAEVRKNVKEAIGLWLEASDIQTKRTRESRVLEVAV